MGLLAYHGTVVHASVKVPGFHCWPGAPEHRAYLRQPHRHEFQVNVAVWAGHDDREVEFHDLQDAITATVRRLFPFYYNGHHDRGKCYGEARDFGTNSCEQIAKLILEELTTEYKVSLHAAKVSEDGENWAVVYVKGTRQI